MNTEKNEPRVNLGGDDLEEKVENERNREENPYSENQENLGEEVNNLKKEVLLALAENKNLRKRHEKEKEEAIKFAASSALSQLTGPFEILYSSLKVEVPEELQENEFVKSMMEGQMLVKKEFEKIFEKVGLIRLYPVGEKFDPLLHQAVSQVPDETKDAGTIINVISAGFMLHGRVIKYANVVVTK